MSDFRVGDTVRWRSSLWRGNPKVITEVGLESSNPVMPGAQVRVRLEDGHTTRVWVSDIELVPGAERGPDPGARRRGKCRSCSRTFALRDTGRLRSHNIKGTGRRCGGSGQVPA